MSSTPPSAIRANAMMFGKGTLFSRILGFARDAAMAAILGGGWVADALFLALRLPYFTRTLLAEGAFAYTLVPAYRQSKIAGSGNAWQFIRSATMVLVCIFGVFALAGALFSKHLTLLLAPGFASMPDVLSMAATFLAISVISLPLAAGAAVCSAALVAEGFFRRPAFSSAVFNMTLLAVAAAAYLLYGANGQDLRIPYALCAGAVLGGAAQWLYQAAPLVRMGFSFRGPLALSAPNVATPLRALPASAFGFSGNHVNILIATVLASFLAEGSISALYFAERLIAFPLGVIGASMGLAALSDLSSIANATNSGSYEEFASRLGAALRATLFLALPAAVGTACLAPSMTAALFGHGAFSPDALARTSAALLAYVAGLPALAAIRPLLAGLGALGDAKTPMRAALAGGSATLVCGVALLAVGAPWGPALAVSLGAWVNAMVLLRVFATRGLTPLPDAAWLFKAFAASAVMALCVLQTAPFFSSHTGKLATIPLGGAVYFAAAALLRFDENHLLSRIVKKITLKA